MSFINRSSQEMYCKVIYVGPKGSGKTTNIQWIYKKTKSKASEDSKWIALPKEPPPTELFDFLPLSAGEVQGFETRFHLYAAGSGNLFQPTGKMILKGVDGIVFVADSSPERMEDNSEYLSRFYSQLKEEGYDLEKLPFVIQYNKRDLKNAAPLFRMKNSLNVRGAPDQEAAAKRGEGVFETFKMISNQILASLKN